MAVRLVRLCLQRFRLRPLPALSRRAVIYGMPSVRRECPKSSLVTTPRSAERRPDVPYSLDSRIPWLIMIERTPRIERRSERGLTRLTDRDLWMLEALGRMRFLTTSQLARLAFGKSRPAANKRLRQLLNSGLVRTWMRDLARDNIYGLTEIGARLLDLP